MSLQLGVRIQWGNILQIKLLLLFSSCYSPSYCYCYSVITCRVELDMSWGTGQGETGCERGSAGVSNHNSPNEFSFNCSEEGKTYPKLLANSVIVVFTF